MSVPVVALNVPVVEPDATVTEEGTDNAPALLESDTVPPLDLDSVTVQLDVPELPRLVGLQESPLTRTAATNEIFWVRLLPLSDAVTVAV